MSKAFKVFKDSLIERERPLNKIKFDVPFITHITWHKPLQSQKQFPP